MKSYGGDFDYDAHGQGYANIRRPDPRKVGPRSPSTRSRISRSNLARLMCPLS